MTLKNKILVEAFLDYFLLLERALVASNGTRCNDIAVTFFNKDVRLLTLSVPFDNLSRRKKLLRDFFSNFYHPSAPENSNIVVSLNLTSTLSSNHSSNHLFAAAREQRLVSAANAMLEYCNKAASSTFQIPVIFNSLSPVVKELSPEEKQARLARFKGKRPLKLKQPVVAPTKDELDPALLKKYEAGKALLRDKTT